MDTLNINNREIAIAIWAGVFVVWALLPKSIRESFVQVLRAFTQKVILLSTVLMLIYAGVMVFVFHKIQLWDVSNLKDTILWVFGVAFVMLVSINSARDEGYFRKTVLDNVKLVLVLEFVVNLYAFALWIELIFMPVLIIVGMLMGYSSTNLKYKKVESLLTFIMGFFGIVVLIFTLYGIFTDFQAFASLDNLRDFLLIPVFTLGFLPFVYLMALYLVYDLVFYRIDYLANDSEITKYAKRKTVLAFHFNLGALKKWLRSMGMLRINDRQDFLTAIKQFKGKGA